MGQYWLVVNLTKREFVHPHRLGTGLKLWEQLANHPGTGAALIILCAAMPEPRGGGDFDLDANWHGPERTAAMKARQIDGGTPGPMPEDYPTVAKRTIGRWAGDRIALIGDYAERGDIRRYKGSVTEIWEHCHANHHRVPSDPVDPDAWTDVSDDVCRVIEHELQGRYSDDDGWRQFTFNSEDKDESTVETNGPTAPNGNAST